jgi:hypothetical protein
MVQGKGLFLAAGLLWTAQQLLAGEDAVIAANEAAAAAACIAYAEAQEIYHRTDYNMDGFLEYAQTLHGGRKAMVKAPDAASLPQPTEEERQKASKFIRDLASDDFAVREQASEELAKLGPKVLKQLQAAQKEQTDAEVLHRCRKLAEQITIAVSPAARMDLRFGLYSSGRDLSVEGDLCLIDKALAEAEWPSGSDGSNAAPKQGYFFRVLTRQGAAALRCSSPFRLWSGHCAPHCPGAHSFVGLNSAQSLTYASVCCLPPKSRW